MKFQVALFVFGVLTFAASQPLDLHDEDLTDVIEAEVEDNQLWHIPQIDGSMKWMTEQEAKDRTLKTELVEKAKWVVKHFSNKRRKVRFFLFTQNNPSKWQEIDMERPETLQRSNFNSSHPTRIFAHGWLGGLHAPQTIEIVDSHLANGRKENYNMIIADWSVWSMTVNYYLARLRTRKAGAKTAELIDWLHENTGMPFETLHVFGHSLGAHVAGFTGKQVTKGKIRTIIGLDPAMPLFRLKNPHNRLANTDAEYVETLHTNGLKLGFFNPIGQAAFYPNGGRIQPGCGKDYHGGCAHLLAPTYLAEAVAKGYGNSFHSIKCDSFDAMKKRQCYNFNEDIRMGDPENYKKAKGVYYLETHPVAPFGMGDRYIKERLGL